MIFRLAVRSLTARPVRSGVLAVGFGVGIGVMASLLGIGDVILDQARSPGLRGGGDVIVAGSTGSVDSARFVLRSLLDPSETGRVRAASPRVEGTLYLIEGESATPIYARGGIPSLERAVGDPETSGIDAWRDAPTDERWTSPTAEDVLRAMDRFHPVPDHPELAGSWAEWLYFNGSAESVRFYLSFLVGPRSAPGKRDAAVRLQLERNGRLTSFSERAVVSEEDLDSAPDLTIGSSSVRLSGLDYTITLDLEPESGDGSGITGDLVLRAVDGASMPPMVLRGAGGWISGYTVPVLSGSLAGRLVLGEQTFDLDGGRGYHDHNWGFWEGVSWQWGQVEIEDLSIVYGKVIPPANVADPDRVPAVLVATGPDGPLGFGTTTTIHETDDADGRPRTIEIKSLGDGLDLALRAEVEQIETSRVGRRRALAGNDLLFLQMRVTYGVSGRVDDRDISYEGPGSAETFRPAGTVPSSSDAADVRRHTWESPNDRFAVH